MSEPIGILAVAALVGLGVWVLGSPLLRLTGALAVLAGLVAAALGNPDGLGAVCVGAALWLCGQWLYGVRNQAFASPLARRLFQQTPLRHLDPTRGWELPGGG